MSSREASSIANCGASDESATGVVPLIRPTLSGYDILRVLIAGLLLTAAALKGHALATAPTAEAGLLTSRWFLIGVVEFELFFALWLLGGFYPTHTRRAAMALFLLFGATAFYQSLTGHSSCGCFGKVQISPWAGVIIDSAVLSALFFCRPPQTVRSYELGPAWLRPIGLGSAFLASGPLAALAMATYTPTFLSADGVVVGDGRNVLLKPESWVGHRLPLTAAIDIGSTLEDGHWILVLYNHACPKCQQLLSRYRVITSRSSGVLDAPRVALVEVAPYGGGEELSDSRCVIGRLDDEWNWFIELPCELRMRNGKVTQVGRGELTARIDGHNH